MSGINKVILMGHVGQDPQIFTTAAGTKIANVSLATSKKGKDQESVTQWHSLVAFAKIADLCELYVVKGTKLVIEGEIQYQTYEKDGEKRWSTKIIVSSLHFCGDANHEAKAKPAPKAKKSEPSYEDIDDSEIPF